jgi:hypothetical protein
VQKGEHPSGALPMPYEHAAGFRFYEELNDFPALEQRNKTLRYEFNGHPRIK